jgi:hypothetical protein
VDDNDLRAYLRELGKRGGEARAERLSVERLRAIGKKGAQARWRGSMIALALFSDIVATGKTTRQDFLGDWVSRLRQKLPDLTQPEFVMELRRLFDRGYIELSKTINTHVEPIDPSNITENALTIYPFDIDLTVSGLNYHRDLLLRQR